MVRFGRINDSDLLPAILISLKATMLAATTAELRLLVDVVAVCLHMVIVVVAATLGSSREVARIVAVDWLLLLLNWRRATRVVLLLLLVIILTWAICAMVVATASLIRRGVLPVGCL